MELMELQVELLLVCNELGMTHREIAEAIDARLGLVQGFFCKKSTKAKGIRYNGRYSSRPDVIAGCAKPRRLPPELRREIER